MIPSLQGHKSKQFPSPILRVNLCPNVKNFSRTSAVQVQAIPWLLGNPLTQREPYHYLSCDSNLSLLLSPNGVSAVQSRAGERGVEGAEQAGQGQKPQPRPAPTATKKRRPTPITNSLAQVGRLLLMMVVMQLLLLLVLLLMMVILLQLKLLLDLLRLLLLLMMMSLLLKLPQDPTHIW